MSSYRHQRKTEVIEYFLTNAMVEDGVQRAASLLVGRAAMLSQSMPRNAEVDGLAWSASLIGSRGLMTTWLEKAPFVDAGEQASFTYSDDPKTGKCDATFTLDTPDEAGNRSSMTLHARQINPDTWALSLGSSEVFQDAEAELAAAVSSIVTAANTMSTMAINALRG